MQPSQIKAITATAAITTATSYLRGVTLTGAADAAVAVVRAGGASGTVILTVKAAIATTSHVDVASAICAEGIHVTITGTTPACTVVYA